MSVDRRSSDPNRQMALISIGPLRKSGLTIATSDSRNLTRRNAAAALDVGAYEHFRSNVTGHMTSWRFDDIEQ
jgi:hypothetical protein